MTIPLLYGIINILNIELIFSLFFIKKDDALMTRRPRSSPPQKRVNLKFDSRKEADRYRDLLLLEQAGAISHIELQPKYNLIVNGYKLGFYKADFRHEDVATSTVIVEDVKGVRTAVYQLKKKLVKALYGIEIIEI